MENNRGRDVFDVVDVKKGASGGTSVASPTSFQVTVWPHYLPVHTKPVKHMSI